MSIDIKVPSVGESITEVQISKWLKQPGDRVEMDEDLVEVESEKASVQLPAPAAGTLDEILIGDGEIAQVGQVVGRIREAGEESANGKSTDSKSKPKAKTPEPSTTDAPAEKQSQRKSERKQARKAERAQKAAKKTKPTKPSAKTPEDAADVKIMPAAKRLLAQYNLDPADVEATGPGGRLLKEDVLRHLDQQETPQSAEVASEDEAPADSANHQTEEVSREPATEENAQGHDEAEDELEEIVPMSFIRKRIAARLVQAQQQAALLTTFNEIDMTEVIELRARYKEAYVERHGVKLGFMSFFVKGAVEALRQFPAVNAEIRDENIVYRKYYDIGIAVGGGKGLVVPVLRHAEELSFAEIEQQIADFGQRAKSNRLTPDELSGGTFTISNGGIYGSLLSTPIVNPPQSGILGLHAIQDRPIALNKQVVIRPMMYVALTYDHRLVDGREAVTFLRTLKDLLEDPARLFLQI